MTAPAPELTLLYALPTLVPEAPIFAWLSRLDCHAPCVVLDLSQTQLNGPGLRALVQEIQERGMRVAGVVGIQPAQLGDQPGQMPPILPRPAQDFRALRPAATPPPPPPPAAAAVAGLLVEGHVRSGQRIAHAGDVTVIGTVSSGAEIVAGGSVQVHGVLRGRATAGPGGHIYCQALQAELLMIGGVFLAADDMDAARIGTRVIATSDGAAIALRPMA